MGTTTVPAATAGIAPDLAAISRDFPGFRAWQSDAGHLYAAGSVSLCRGSGVTLDSDTPDGLRAEIAAHLNAMRRGRSA